MSLILPEKYQRQQDEEKKLYEQCCNMYDNLKSLLTKPKNRPEAIEQLENDCKLWTLFVEWSKDEKDFPEYVRDFWERQVENTETLLRTIRSLPEEEIYY